MALSKGIGSSEEQSLSAIEGRGMMKSLLPPPAEFIYSDIGVSGSIAYNK